MWKRLSAVLFLSFSTCFLCAQRVLYSPFISSQPETRFEVIGKAGDYYWIQKSRRKINTKMSADPWVNDKGLSLEIYDERVNPVRSIPSSISANMIKEYFINYYYHNADLTVDLKDNSVEVHNNNAEPFKITLVETGLDTMTAGRLRRAAMRR